MYNDFRSYLHEIRVKNENLHIKLHVHGPKCLKYAYDFLREHFIHTYVYTHTHFHSMVAKVSPLCI